MFGPCLEGWPSSAVDSLSASLVTVRHKKAALCMPASLVTSSQNKIPFKILKKKMSAVLQVFLQHEIEPKNHSNINILELGLELTPMNNWGKIEETWVFKKILRN